MALEIFDSLFNMGLFPNFNGPLGFSKVVCNVSSNFFPWSVRTGPGKFWWSVPILKDPLPGPLVHY